MNNDDFSAADVAVGEEIATAADDDYVPANDYVPAPAPAPTPKKSKKAKARAPRYEAVDYDTTSSYRSIDSQRTENWNKSNGQFKTFEDMFNYYSR